MKVVLRQEAASDTERAAAWYEHEREGLGERLLGVLRRTLRELGRHPARYPRVHGEIRRILTPRPFPYQVFFLAEPARKRVVVLRILHQAQDSSVVGGGE